MRAEILGTRVLFTKLNSRPTTQGDPGVGLTAAQSLSIMSLKWSRESLSSLPRHRRLPPSCPLSQPQSQASPPPLQESLVFAAIGKTSSAHTQVLHQPQVLHLVPDQHLIKAAWDRGNRVVSGLALMANCPCQDPATQAHGQEGPTGLFGIIGLDAADISRLLRLKYFYQLQEAHLELGGNLVSKSEWKVGLSWAEVTDAWCSPSVGQSSTSSHNYTYPPCPPLLPPTIPPHNRGGGQTTPTCLTLVGVETAVYKIHSGLKILLRSPHFNSIPPFGKSLFLEFQGHIPK